MKSFSENLKEIRKDKGFSQKELGEAIGIGQTTVANYEKGLRFPSQDILLAMADLLKVSVDVLLGREVYQLAPFSTNRFSDKQLEELKKRLFRELMNENESGVYDLFDTEIIRGPNSGKVLVQVYEEIITPVMYMVGEAWEEGQISVAKEHYVTAIMLKLVSYISLEAYKGISNYDSMENGLVDSQKNKTVICMSLSSEAHTLGIRMITDYFMLLGYKSYYIGTDVPTDALYKMIDDVSPEIIAISATMKYHLDSVKNLIQLIRLHNQHVKIIVGGQGFNRNNHESIGADSIVTKYSELENFLK